jgi:hypothetical protein
MKDNELENQALSEDEYDHCKPEFFGEAVM